MILDSDSVELFGGKKRASKQERKAARQQIRKEKLEARKQAKQFRKEGKRAEAKAVRKAFRQKAKTLRREKGMGLLGLGKSILPRKKQTANSDSQMPANAQENAQEVEEVVASSNSGQDATQFSEPRTIATTSSASLGKGFSTSAGNQTGSQDTGQDSSQDDEGTDENNSEKPKKKSKKWLWIGGGIALLLIAVVLFLVLKNKE